MSTAPSATLSAIRERADAAADFPLAEFARFTAFDTKSVGGWIAASAMDVPLLVAALEAVLALADKWDRVDARLSEMGHASAPVGDLRREMAFSHAKVFEDCAASLREAITTALQDMEKRATDDRT